MPLSPSTSTFAPLVALITTLACVDTTAPPARLAAPPSFDALASLPPPAAPAPTRPPARPATERGVRLPSPLGVVYVPHAVIERPIRAFDLVVHFHGDTTSSEDAIDRAGLDVVLVTVNLGASSDAYAQRLGAPTALDDLVRGVESTLHRRLAAPEARADRVALSAWSAGYAAVLRLIAAPSAAARVDAVLLEDGPHAMFRDPQRRTIDERRLEPLVAWARRAVAGEVLLGWTHSAIPTLSYASTTETTGFVLDALAIAREPADAREGPLRRTSAAERGAFHLRGYAGTTARDHCDHLLSLSRTLLPLLRDRWRG